MTYRLADHAAMRKFLRKNRIDDVAFLKAIQERIIYLETFQSSKIKSTYASFKGFLLLECRVHVDKKDYRVAYYTTPSETIIFFASSTLHKQSFCEALYQLQGVTH